MPDPIVPPVQDPNAQPANPAVPPAPVVDPPEEHEPMAVPVKTLIVSAVILTVIGLLIWAAIAFWPSKGGVTRSSSPSEVGNILGVPETLEERVQAESYDIGRQDGLDRRGIHVVGLEELREIADRGIRKYSRYVGDPNYQDPPEEEDRPTTPGRVEPQPQPDASRQGTQRNVPSPSHQGNAVPMQSVVVPHQSAAPVQQPARVILQQNLLPQPPVVNRPSTGVLQQLRKILPQVQQLPPPVVQQPVAPKK